MRRRAVVLLVALVVLCDAVILALAAWNRSGGPECVLTLTERELALPEVMDEDSTGLALSLVAADLPWLRVKRVARRRGIDRRPLEYDWLDARRLAHLGFTTAWDSDDSTAMERYARRTVRPMFVALEVDGKGFAALIAARERELEEARSELAAGKTDAKRVEGLTTMLALDRVMGSRLVPIDVDADPRSLRDRHPDRGRVAVVPGLVRLAVERPPVGGARLCGRVTTLVGGIDVPLRFRPRLSPLLHAVSGWHELDDDHGSVEIPPWPAPTPPRYAVKVAFGRSYEPWILDITPLGVAH